MNAQGAQLLLEEMLKASASEFEGGVRLYLEGDKRLKKAKKSLNKALSDCAAAMDMKRNGFKAIKSEYKFLNGEETVKPGIDAEYVCTRLIMGIIESMSDSELEELREEVKYED